MAQHLDKIAAILVLYSILPFIKSQNEQFLDLTLEQGEVRGFLSEDGGFFSFLGIPYAAAPTGNHRFKAPLAPPSWSGKLNANNRVMCPQIDFDGGTNDQTIEGTYYGVEDCLVVNVFVPATVHSSDTVPVMVYTHGGGYISGFGEIITKKIKLLEQKMIIVTFNYRLGALGFLCLRTEEAPGNAGLKDQVAALQWVQNNIARFGGNPGEVTLYGHSAGSTSVELLALSKATEGLFNKIILESGSAIAGWAVSYDPIGAATIIADVMGYQNVSNLKDLANIYRNVPAQELVTITFQTLLGLTRQHLFIPCVERDSDDTSVLIDSPMNILQSGNFNAIPTLIAYMDMECIMNAFNFHNGWDKIFHDRLSDFIYSDLYFPTDEERYAVEDDIKKFYLERSESDLQAFIDFQTDLYFFYPAVKTSYSYTANSAPVYLMEFSYHDNSSEFGGASHSDFYLHVFEIELKGSGGKLAADRLTTMLWNYIKYGNPVPSTSELLPVQWPTVGPEVSYLSFAEDVSVGESPWPERYQLWSNIFSKYYNTLPLPDDDGDQPGNGYTVSSCALTVLFMFSMCMCYALPI